MELWRLEVRDEGASMVGFVVKASLLTTSSLCLFLVQRKREGVKSCSDSYRSRAELREPLEPSFF